MVKKGVMALSQFPVGSVVKLRTGGKWHGIKRFQNGDAVCVLQERFSDKKECFRGSNTLVVDWLVGGNFLNIQ
jgi:uncharacterized protein YodC (DUF2158 family)